MPYLLDTNVCVFYLRGVPAVRQKLQAVGRDACAVCEATIFELRYGAENSDDPIEGHQRIDDFLEGLEILPIISSIMCYAREKTRLRQLGILLHDEFDLLIGTCAIEHHYVLVTDNTKHFARFQNIELENRLVR